MIVLQRAPKKALILSPAASHPQDFGNRRRVYETAMKLRENGHEIHFLLYPMEPDWMERVQDSARAMRSEWDSFSIIPSSRPPPLQTPAIGEHHLIDEWWDPAIETHLRWIFAHEFFDVFVTNYAFLSKALEFAPPETIKVLETHDRFSGRKELLTALGDYIESFYTTETDERIALERSDIVIAIKDSEAEFYQRLSTRNVLSIPFWLDRAQKNIQCQPPAAQNTLRAGFIGALNVVNVANMKRFLRRFETIQRVYAEDITLDVAGDVCRFLDSSSASVRFLGRVETLEEFYDNIDVVVVPMMLSTGLKIKVAEAMSYGKAIVSTQNGFDGFSPTDEFHSLQSIDLVCDALVTLSLDRGRLDVLRSRTALASSLARARSEAGYRSLMSAIARKPPTIVFLTDLPVFDAKSVRAERLAQWCQLCTKLGATIVIYLGEQSFEASRIELGAADILAIPKSENQISDVLACLHELTTSRSIVEVVISAEKKLGPLLWSSLRPHVAHMTLDTWHPQFAKNVSKYSGGVEPDLWLAPEREQAGATGWCLEATAFRYLPTALRKRGKDRRPGKSLIVLCGPDQSDRNGIVMLISGASSTRCVAIDLATSLDSDFDDGFFDALNLLEAPASLIAIGRNDRAVAICRSLAALLQIPCLHVSGRRFPILMTDASETPYLCCTYAELSQHVEDVRNMTYYVPQDRDKPGWDAYCEIVRSRSRKSITSKDSPKSAG